MEPVSRVEKGLSLSSSLWCQSNLLHIILLVPGVTWVHFLWSVSDFSSRAEVSFVWVGSFFLILGSHSSNQLAGWLAINNQFSITPEHTKIFVNTCNKMFQSWEHWSEGRCLCSTVNWISTVRCSARWGLSDEIKVMTTAPGNDLGWLQHRRAEQPYSPKTGEREEACRGHQSSLGLNLSASCPESTSSQIWLQS